MHILTHLFSSWTISAICFPDDRRKHLSDINLVTLSGLAPDLDGLGIIPELLTSSSEQPLYWWSEYHHILCHNLGFAITIAALLAWKAKLKLRTFILSFLVFHIHLLADIAGSRGPDGEQWAIPYLLPFSGRWQLIWSGQWDFNGWQNIIISILFLITTIWISWKWGASPLNMLNRSADEKLTSTLRKRFGVPFKTSD